MPPTEETFTIDPPPLVIMAGAAVRIPKNTPKQFMSMTSWNSSVGMSTIYLLFAGVGMTALLSIYLTVPETKGKTLEEIEAMF